MSETKYVRLRLGLRDAYTHFIKSIWIMNVQPANTIIIINTKIRNSNTIAEINSQNISSSNSKRATDCVFKRKFISVSDCFIKSIFGLLKYNSGTK